MQSSKEDKEKSVERCRKCKVFVFVFGKFMCLCQLMFYFDCK